MDKIKIIMNTHIKEYFDNAAYQWDERCKYNMSRIDTIVSLARIKKNDHVIDIACGTGILTSSLLERGAQINGVDISDKMIEIAKNKYHSAKLSFEVLDFMKNQKDGYNIAIMHNAYPHFINKEELAKKIYDCLKPGGRFMIAHSVNKDRINSCHSNTNHNISVELKPVEEEAVFFKPFFKIDTLIDNSHIYVLSGVKKEI